MLASWIKDGLSRNFPTQPPAEYLSIILHTLFLPEWHFPEISDCIRFGRNRETFRLNFCYCTLLFFLLHCTNNKLVFLSMNALYPRTTKELNETKSYIYTFPIGTFLKLSNYNISNKNFSAVNQCSFEAIHPDFYPRSNVNRCVGTLLTNHLKNLTGKPMHLSYNAFFRKIWRMVSNSKEKQKQLLKLKYQI